MSEGLRLDKWLWAARFYKTRALAVEAIQGGHVHLRGHRVKPSRSVLPGDELSIRKEGVEFVITVVALSSKRGPASVARELYLESGESIAQRMQIHEERRLAALAGEVPARRPDKRERRRIIHFTRKGE